MNIQDLAVFTIVALAATYLVRDWLHASKSGGGCGKCHSCPSSKTPAKAEPQLVQIDLGGSWKRPG